MKSLPEKIKSTIRDLYENRAVRRLLIAFFGAFAIIAEYRYNTVTNQPEFAILGLLTIILLYLEIFETGLLRIDDYLSRPSIVSKRTETESEESLSERIESRIKDFEPRTVHLLDLSGQNAAHVLKTTLDKDNDIETYLLIKIPQSANTTKQYKQIKTFLTQTLPTICRENKSENLHVRLYPQDSVVRGRLIGKRYLILSWYIRIFSPPISEEETDLMNVVPDPTESFEAIRDGENRGNQKLWGDNVVHIEFSRENDGFEELKEDFFKNRLYKNLWAAGITPNRLYELEQEIDEDEPIYSENNPKGDDDRVRPYQFGRPLFNWIDKNSISEEKRNERQAYLEAISDSSTDPDDLFDWSVIFGS